MSGSIQDRIFAFVQSRKERGATAAEIASAYLFPTGTQPAIAEKLAQSILSSDARLTRRADGLWVALAPAGPAAAPGFTVLESVGVMVGRRPCEVECSAIRLDAAQSIRAGYRPHVHPPCRRSTSSSRARRSHWSPVGSIAIPDKPAPPGGASRYR